jgi:hypothetical protein
MGSEAAEFTPIPSPTLPLKGKEKCSGALKLALMRLRRNDMFSSCTEITLNRHRFIVVEVEPTFHNPVNNPNAVNKVD